MRSSALAGVIFMACGLNIQAPSWGTIKAQIVWGDATIPERETINVTKDQSHCLSKGPLLSEAVLIDPATKGLKNVMVWIRSSTDDPLPIHPNLKNVPADTVTVDQPMCQFEPRVVAMREGQTLVLKNSSAVAHSAQFSGRANVGSNQLIPPGGMIEFSGDKALKAESKPLPLTCALHGWMGGLIGVFNHPYFAISNNKGMIEIKNAPAVECVLFMYHEKFGWLHEGRKSSGQKITIPANDTLNLGMIKK